MPKKPPVHYKAQRRIRCGRREVEKFTLYWKMVTCENCLKLKGRPEGPGICGNS